MGRCPSARFAALCAVRAVRETGGLGGGALTLRCRVRPSSGFGAPASSLVEANKKTATEKGLKTIPKSCVDSNRATRHEPDNPVSLFEPEPEAWIRARH